MVVTLQSEQTFPVGTSVEAYAASSQLSENLGSSPRGTPIDTQTVRSDGTLVFPSLDEGEYYAVAFVGGKWRYLRFSALEDSSPQAISELNATLEALLIQATVLDLAASSVGDNPQLDGVPSKEIVVYGAFFSAEDLVKVNFSSDGVASGSGFTCNPGGGFSVGYGLVEIYATAVGEALGLVLDADVGVGGKLTYALR